MSVSRLGTGRESGIRRRGILVPGIVLTLLALCSNTPASPASAGSGGESLFLRTDSQGAHVSVWGEVSMAGVAPLPISTLPVGEYTFHAEGPGLPLVRGRFVLSAAGLSRRPWAGPSAILLPPGFVHLERGDSRGWTLAGAAVTGATMMMVNHGHVRNSRDRMNRAERVYALAISEEAIEDARYTWESSVRELDDRKEIRRLWGAVLGAAWLGAALEATLLTPQPRFSAQDDGRTVMAEVPRAGAWQAVLRSALVPGGGQRYMGRTSRANLFLTGTAALAAASIATHDSFLKARREQADAQRRFDRVENDLELDQARRELERTADRADERNTIRWMVVGATSGVYIWSVIDAFGLGQSAGIPGLSWTVTPSEDGVLLGATWSMP